MNKDRFSPPTLTAEDRVARRMASLLDEAADTTLGADITERLRFARERAMAKARELRTMPVVVLAGQGWSTVGGLAYAGAGASGSGSTPEGGHWRTKLAALLPLLILALGLLVVQEHLLRDQIDAAAEVDAALLSDDLPPHAYTDPGFAEFLRSGNP